MTRTRVVILGAAGKDFHVFNMIYRDNKDYEVVAFTATQIMGIEGRTYPPELSGDLYPEGIPILDEDNLEDIIQEKEIDRVVFAYSDVKHQEVMNLASRANAYGANFVLHSMDKTMMTSDKPVIAINAVRTGVGKSQTSRYVTNVLNEMGLQVVAMRHPMPYGDLTEQISQRYEEFDDLEKYNCTIEEMEEYLPYIERDMIVYAGVDYEKILTQAEEDAEVIVWDGGNNDTPFIEPDLHICLVDPHRPGHELNYHPGETNFRSADIILVNKCDSADEEGIETVIKHSKLVNPDAEIFKANSPYTLQTDEDISGKKVLVVEDGPTITHGSLSTGAGMLAAKKVGAEVVDPKPYIKGSIKEAFDNYSQLDMALPALGYSEEQLNELEDVINAADCDYVLAGTPIDLARVVDVNKPVIRVIYDLEEIDGTPLADKVRSVVNQ